MSLQDASLEVLHHYDAISPSLCSERTVAALVKRPNAVVWCNSNRDRKILKLDVNKRSTTSALFRAAARELDSKGALEVYKDEEDKFAAVGVPIEKSDMAWVVWRLEQGVYKVHGLFTIGAKHGGLGWDEGDAKEKFGGEVVALKFDEKEVKEKVKAEKAKKPVEKVEKAKKPVEKAEKVKNPAEKKTVKKQPRDESAEERNAKKPRTRADRAAARAAA